jgi:hypothetical protein
MPICHSNTSKTELMASTRVDYIQDLENEIDSKMRLLNAINSVYFYLQEPKRSIFEMRYLIVPIGKPKAGWKQISEEVNMAEDYCRKIDCRIVLDIQTRYILSTSKISEKITQTVHKIHTDIDRAS